MTRIMKLKRILSVFIAKEYIPVMDVKKSKDVTLLNFLVSWYISISGKKLEFSMAKN